MSTPRFMLIIILTTYISVSDSRFVIPAPDLSPSDKPVLYLLGCISFNGIKEHYLTCGPAADWGLEMVNGRDDILPNYELRIVWTESLYSPSHAVFNLYKALYEPPQKIMLYGAGRSTVSEAICIVSHLWNLVQVTPVSISPALSNKEKYPLLFRINTPYRAVIEPYIALLKHFNWTRVSTIYETKALHSLMIDELITLLPEHNITVQTSEIFSANPEVQVQNLQKHDARIIIGGFYEIAAARTMCAAYRIGLYGPKVVWIIPGWFVPGWYNRYLSDCKPEEVATVLNWALGLDIVQYNYKDVAGIAGLKPSVYKERFLAERLGGVYPSSVGMGNAGRCIDALFAVALGLDYADRMLRKSGSSKRLEDFTYEDKEIRELIYQGMHNVSFQGLKDYIKFDKNGDPPGSIQISQYLSGTTVINGYFDAIAGRFEWLKDSPLQWEAGSPPKDSTVRIDKLVFLDVGTYVGMCAASGVGILLSLCFLTFNLVYRNKRFIKMSSPIMNNVIVLGSIVAYMTIFLQETSNTAVLFFCRLRSYFLMLGFSIAFGALFAKTWRVYMIFTRTTKRTVLKDHQLMLIVAALCAIDVIIAVLREVLDPLTIFVSTIRITELDQGDTIMTEKSTRCVSNYSIYFKGAIFCIKGLLLVFGAFLSWQTRKVTIPALNDSQYIGMCVYNIAVLSLLGVVMSFVLTDKINLSYAMVGGFIVFGTTITQLIIFVPKIMKFKSGKVDDANMNTMGTMNMEVPTSLSTNVETGMEGQSQELEETNAFIEQLQKEIEALKGTKGS